MGNKTKTYAGMRVLPIPTFLYPYIVEQMQIANNQINNDEKLLFKPLNQKYSKRANVNSELKRILKRQFNITDISTHSLRHTYGTRCIESGMAPVVVQKLMKLYVFHLFNFYKSFISMFTAVLLNIS